MNIFFKLSIFTMLTISTSSLFSMEQSSNENFTKPAKDLIALLVNRVMINGLAIDNEPYGGPIAAESKRLLLDIKKILNNDRYKSKTKASEKKLINQMIFSLYKEVNYKRTSLQD